MTQPYIDNEFAGPTLRDAKVGQVVWVLNPNDGKQGPRAVVVSKVGPKRIAIKTYGDRDWYFQLDTGYECGTPSGPSSWLRTEHQLQDERQRDLYFDRLWKKLGPGAHGLKKLSTANLQKLVEFIEDLPIA